MFEDENEPTRTIQPGDNILKVSSVKESLNEYFKLKNKYETKIEKNKKKISNNITLSNREKRSEYLKLKPKCINCDRPGGTKFKTIFFPDTDKEDAYREYTAVCGIVADPCDLNIKIQIGKTELLPDILNELQTIIKDYKNEIIDNKNKLLFGYLTTDEVLDKFDKTKDDVEHFTILYKGYLEIYDNLCNNDKKNKELNEAITLSYIEIDKLKECIKLMNDTDNTQYVNDAVNIYVNILQPLLNQIRTLKYNETFVWHNEDKNTCNLIQNKSSFEQLSYSNFTDKVVSYDVGVISKTKKKPKMIIESDSESEKESELPSGVVPHDEPKYVDGGVEWNIKEYQDLWNRMPKKLKNVLMTNHEWMKEFMYNYLNEKTGHTFTAPNELKIPPEELPNGELDFGVKIYNDEYKKLSPNLQKTYMTFYSVKDGVKNYNMLENAMNQLVEKEVGFNKGYF